MKVVFHEDFYSVYTSDPAAAKGRMEAAIRAIEHRAEFITARPATLEEIAAVHTDRHIEDVRRHGLFDISALAAGGAVQAAETGLTEPCFGLIRPPGHHASAASAWGFCYFNNMSVALTAMRKQGKIKSAFVLDFDLHFGDGNVNILEQKDWVEIYNPPERDRHIYVREVGRILADTRADLIGISAGFDHHVDDWGGLLESEDYFSMGMLVKKAAEASGGGCFAILEGGYNHDVLGKNILALMEGMSG